MYTIAKTFEFSASHQLEHLPPDHQCARLHGHNYTVTIELSAPELDDQHFVVDFGVLAVFKTMLDKEFDHRHLNDIIGCPTSERLARHFFNRAAILYGEKVVAVRVGETPKTWAEWRP